MAAGILTLFGMLLGIVAVSCANALTDDNCPAEGCHEESSLVQFNLMARRADSEESEDLGRIHTEHADPPPLACDLAQPQAPRDVTPGYTGDMDAIPPLNGNQMNKVWQTNLHWHLGAEHMSAGEYDGPPPAPECIVPGDKRAGYWCSSEDVDKAHLQHYDWKHCSKKMQVGYTYEFHWVFSSGGAFPFEHCNKKRCWIDKNLSSKIPRVQGLLLRDHGHEGKLIPGLNDTLGGVFNRSTNPHIIVRAQVYRIVNDPSLPILKDFVWNWTTPDPKQVTRYMGSTTGTDFNNTICSPIEVSWQVDQTCHTMSAQSLDAACKKMKNLYKMSSDLEPHGSRELVSKKYVARESYGLYD